MKVEEIVLIWSFEHDAWWNPNSMGYTKNKDDAGRYRRRDAEKICFNANFHLPDTMINEEIREDL